MSHTTRAFVAKLFVVLIFTTGLTGVAVAAELGRIQSLPSSQVANLVATPSSDELERSAEAVNNLDQSVPISPPRETALSPEMLELRSRLQHCLFYYYQQPENAASRSPWGIMHSLIAYGVDTEVIVSGEKINAIGWLCFNGYGRNQRLFYTEDGSLAARQGPGVQGHAGQFLAMLAQSRVMRDYPIKVGDYDFTVADLVEHEKRTCRDGTELTFKLIGLSHYLPSDAKWTTPDGEQWDIPRLIREELKQSVIGAACGGTHRMMGFSYAVRTREKEGGEIIGEWRRAKTFVEDFIEYTLKLQNDDGSFSTNWFEGRGSSRDKDRRLQTTGHVLEWLAYSLPDDRLRDPEIVKSVDYLTNLMLEHRDWEIGPRGHALHALVLYNQRVFGARPGHGAPQTDGAISVADARDLAEAAGSEAEEDEDEDDGRRIRGLFRRRSR